MSAAPGVVVVGIGADGWAGLGEEARAAILSAELLVGGARHLALVPAGPAERMPWPSPLAGLLDRIGDLAERRVCVLASGDPLLHGIGVSLLRRLPAEAVTVIPHPSALSLACARLRWPVADVELLSLVGRPLELLHPALLPGHRVVMLCAGASAAADIAALACARGHGASRIWALENLGGRDERVRETTAAAWGDAPVGSLCTVALECRAEPGLEPLPRAPGLPDEAFEHDGQITKREVRAATLAALVPLPGQHLWDVGAGSGSVAIEWMRIHPSCRATAVEPRVDRAERIARNARALGVPGLAVVHGPAPAALEGLEPPDAVFVGGGVSVPGLVERCWDALAPGGRLVANAVTLEGAAVLAGRLRECGGRLVRLSVERAEPIGALTGWRPAMPVTQWAATRGRP